MSSPLRVLQYGVHDRAYPRNSRIRRYLESLDGVEVRVVERARSGGRVRRALADLTGLWQGSNGAAIILLSEFRLTHAPLVRVVARLRRARIIVDGFVGLHETAVGDWGSVRPESRRARRLAAADRRALAAADLFLIDTEVRASQRRGVVPRRAVFRRAVSRRSAHIRVLPLPVGAPAWAVHRPPSPTSRLRILYYGNYIPLHGLDLVAEALDELHGRRDFEVTFLGSGARREAFEDRVAASAWSPRATFCDPVPEAELADRIADATVVLGVFGDSDKARSVVANKVWQGLACGRTVVTQAGEALADVPPAVRELLVETEPGSAQALAEALSRVPLSPSPVAPRASVLVEEHVWARFAPLGDWVSEVRR
ncbi:glycosyltransferase [Frondihabitans sp. PhB188]|uniref:glycosyltransferase n=1 Tax=Frondihabitans sp. PhB188 TaxID=2485200 RepID=UPI00131544E1|nr:glycosyltransferase [Frondihabitans sp. PhB188]